MEQRAANAPFKYRDPAQPDSPEHSIAPAACRAARPVTGAREPCPVASAARPAFMCHETATEYYCQGKNEEMTTTSD